MKCRWQGIAAKLLGLLAAVVMIGSCAPTTAAPTPKASPTAAPPTAAPAAKVIPTTAAPAATPAPVKVKVGVIGSISDSGIFIAQEKGYFKEQGIDSELNLFRTSQEEIPLLATGELDIGSGSPESGMFNAVIRGIQMKFVAHKGSNKPGFGFAALVVRKDLIDSGKIKDYSDLKGSTVSILSKGSGVELQLEKALQKGKLTLDDVEIKLLGFADAITALANKGIDATISIEPLIAVAAEKGILVRWKGVDDFYPNDQAGVVIYSGKFMERDPDAARRWMVAYVKGLRDYNDAFMKSKGRAEVVSILAKNTNITDPALYDKIFLAGLDADGYVLSGDIALKQDWFVAKGYVSRKLDLKEVVDNQYVDFAIQKLGKYQ